MLKKLLKYDLMWINKNLIYFYAIAFIFAISGRLLSLIDNSMLASVISKICFGITISFVINAIVNGIIRSWVRFINNCYKDESYLTHTLPVTKKEIYLSKFIASIITMVVGVIISIISLAICYLSADFIESIRKTFATNRGFFSNEFMYLFGRYAQLQSSGNARTERWQSV